jgi:hypothetical protein
MVMWPESDQRCNLFTTFLYRVLHKALPTKSFLAFNLVRCSCLQGLSIEERSSNIGGSSSFLES